MTNQKTLKFNSIKRRVTSRFTQLRLSLKKLTSLTSKLRWKKLWNWTRLTKSVMKSVSKSHLLTSDVWLHKQLSKSSCKRFAKLSVVLCMTSSSVTRTKSSQEKLSVKTHASCTSFCQVTKRLPWSKVTKCQTKRTVWVTRSRSWFHKFKTNNVDLKSLCHVRTLTW